MRGAATVVERRDLPLFAWDERRNSQRRAARQACARSILIAAGIGSTALAATIVLPPSPHLVWNASASAPVGLYRVSAATSLRRGDMVIAWLPSATRTLAARRHYLPANVPLVKRVAAIAGDTVCAVGPVVSVNGDALVERRRFDGARRRLPWWEGCTTLGDGEFLLLMTDAPDSFDGRYFGPSRAADIVGKARLIWSRPTKARGDA